MSRRQPQTDPPNLDAPELRALRRKLLAWYGRNARDLPWRKNRDPYRVWLSEVMLQQTQVEAVRPYFLRFTGELPAVEDLASADESRVLRLWEGLGYYRRARSLHAAAKKIVAEHDGRLPDTLEGLMALPGVGRYTAGAILSIAYDKRAPIVEANTRRLYARLMALEVDPTSTEGERRLWEFAERLLPRSGFSNFSQALMELGSLVCTPKTPRCDACPVAKHCRAYQAGAIESLAPVTRKVKFTDLREAAVVVRKADKVLVRQCGEGERWAGLWDFPRFELEAESPAGAKSEITQKVRELTGVACEPTEKIATLKHGVTRYRITLECYEARHTGGRLRSNKDSPAQWVAPSELADTPLSVTGRKLAGRIGG
ncbi:putative A/G-specific adenine glycosylase YfhQ [Pseudobythopirellula maris]|uniref:Adenine DNA glycosylase n=1 Tax=Pseudobythopirellula maris TaxID=2527991 RepID=A0A5C5ZMU5_9BACT|nr:A/G-specific adenine glycosylase [Pseudobythopirellula maris]TWT88792.1 putative A/G-specific adenine glycosylase YfhQ [Pseudobythopirellula maris]